jgi:hypothetical protein
MRHLRLTRLLLIAALLLPGSARAEDPPKRPTHARGGARIGAITGGVLGAVSLVSFGLLVEAIGESDSDDDITPLGYVGLGALGLASGAAAGGVLGWVFGSMIPAYDPRAGYPPTGEAGRATARPDSPPIASFTLQPGFGSLTQRSGRASSLSMRATLLAHVHRLVALGPEYTNAGFAGGMSALGGAVYIGDRTRRWSPYLVGDLGSYHWSHGIHDSHVTVLGSGIGAGFLWAPASGRARLGLEGRYHWTPQNIEDPEGYRFVNFGVTARTSW